MSILRLITVAALAVTYATTAWWRHTAAELESTSASLFLRVFASAWLLLVVVWNSWRISVYPFYVSPLRHLPQPQGNEFFLGQYRRLIREMSGGPALEWINTIPNDGLIRYLSIFNSERLLITNPRALAEVLVARNYDFEKPKLMRQDLARLLGVGVLLAEGDEHRFQRKQLAPAFAFRHIKELYPVFWRKARESVAVIRREAATADPAVAFEISGVASRATLDIIGLAGLGRDFASLREPDNPLAATYRVVFQPNAQARVLTVLASILPLWLLVALPLQRNRDLNNARRFLRQTCADLVREKAQAGEADTATDILSVALASGAFSEANLVDQLMTFLAAGHETTSAALTWAVYLLCVHPDVQDRLRAEVRAHLPPLGDAGSAHEGDAAARDITPADIDHLPYLHAVCNEVLRFYAPVPATMREAAVDTTIQGQRVPRGTIVMLMPWAVNKSEALWGSDAGQFDPERWLRKENKEAFNSAGGASNYAFLTFLHGPRSCIGMAFARAEFACLLAAWVGRFEFRLRDAADLDEANLCIRGNISSRPDKGLFVRVTPLDGW